MTDREWSKLCRNIYENKCILMIGAEFPIELTVGGQIKNTTLAALLKAKISAEIVGQSHLSKSTDYSTQQNDLCQLARDFIIYGGSNQVEAREDLETLLVDYLYEIEPAISSDAYNSLASMPFYFIVDTNYGNLFQRLLHNKGKRPRSHYYNYKGSQVIVSNLDSRTKKVGTPEEPFLYKLYGSIDEPKSMAVTDYDLIQLLTNIISKTPGLPADVRAELAHEDTSILFIGFGILVKNWYFRILLHALTSGNKKTMSYALDYLNNINYNDDPTVLFFKDELKVCLYQFDQNKFIETLSAKFNAFAGRHAGLPGAKKENGSTQLTDEIKVFVSYKREDKEKVKALIARLEWNNLVVLWDQSDDFTGDWEGRIEKMVDNADAFILMQSMSLQRQPVNYVNVEIRLAMKRANHYPRLDIYLFPAYVDTPESRLTDTDFNFIKTINNWDLSRSENVDKLAKEIIRNKERNRKLTTA